MRAQPIRAVVFDAVGTLIYPEPSVATVYTTVGRRCGSKLSEVDVARRFRAVFGELETRDRVGDQTTSEQSEYERWQTVVRRVLDDVTDHSACFTELWRHFASPSSWQVFPEVPAVLGALAAGGLRLAIASNFDSRLFEIARQIEAIRSCDPVLVSSQIGFRKPHARFFEAIPLALRNEPAEIMFVGDDPQNDVVPARAAGFRAVLVDRAGAAANGTIKSLAELCATIMRE